jgi:hypothetical protein
MFQEFHFQAKALKVKAITATVIWTLLAFSSIPASAQNCDRACLAGMITQYVDALVENDPSSLPLADKVKYTEDSSALELGEGVWQTVTGKQDFRQDYLDTRKQVAASHVALNEGENQLLYSVLLYVEGMKITGIETLVQRITPTSRFQPRVLGEPIRGMNDSVPAQEKQSRKSMIDTALTYPEGLRIGSFTDGETPFSSEAYRVENGWITAGGGCGRDDCSMYSQYITLHPTIISSVAAVDEENGTVLLWMNFGHAGDSYGVGNSLVTFEAFKIWGNEIHAINAFFTSLPLQTARFWPSLDAIPK